MAVCVLYFTWYSWVLAALRRCTCCTLLPILLGISPPNDIIHDLVALPSCWGGPGIFNPSVQCNQNILLFSLESLVLCLATLLLHRFLITLIWVWNNFLGSWLFIFLSSLGTPVCLLTCGAIWVLLYTLHWTSPPQGDFVSVICTSSFRVWLHTLHSCISWRHSFTV